MLVVRAVCARECEGRVEGKSGAKCTMETVELRNIVAQLQAQVDARQREVRIGFAKMLAAKETAFAKVEQGLRLEVQRLQEVERALSLEVRQLREVAPVSATNSKSVVTLDTECATAKNRDAEESSSEEHESDDSIEGWRSAREAPDGGSISSSSCRSSSSSREDHGDEDNADGGEQDNENSDGNRYCTEEGRKSGTNSSESKPPVSSSEHRQVHVCRHLERIKELQDENDALKTTFRLFHTSCVEQRARLKAIISEKDDLIQHLHNALSQARATVPSAPQPSRVSLSPKEAWMDHSEDAILEQLASLLGPEPSVAP